MRLAVAALAATLALSAAGDVPLAAQTSPGDDVTVFLVSLQHIVQQGDAAAYESLLATTADRERAAEFVSAEMRPGITRAVIQERDRSPLPGTLPGNGYHLTVDAFEEFGPRARIASWRLDIKRAPGPDDATEWRIADQERLSSVDLLYQLALNPDKQFTAHNLHVRDEDLDLTLLEGSVFVAENEQGATAVVLVGRGSMTFRPAQATERGQVKIFSGAESLETSFDFAYFRINPGDFDRLFSSQELVVRPVDPDDFRRADRAFHEGSPKSYSLDLGDLSRATWSLVPNRGDFVAEIHTRRFETLTYARNASEPEDVNLFDRRRRKTIALYPSKQRVAPYAPSPAADDERAGYEVLHYDIEISVAPSRQRIDARARMRVRIRANAVSSLTVRLAEALVVQSVVSDEYGRLFSMRVRNQNIIVVNLPGTMLRGSEFSLTVSYGGRVETQTLDSETIALQQPGLADTGGVEVEQSFLYSNRSSWYPEPPIGGFMTATLRILVPADLDCVASGALDAGSPVLVPDPDAALNRKLYVFSARQPVRYLAFIVSRFAGAQNVEIAFSPRKEEAGVIPSGIFYRTLTVSVEANPRQVARGRDVGERAVDIALFYQSLLDDVPYPSFTVALVENDLPGGHSPAYFAAVNQTLPTSPYVWRNDPAAFDNYPAFFLAHEMAHQWWGQAIGWRGYHEQWLSEGFSQYFAALYAKRQRGNDTFANMMRQMRKWAREKSDEGPISLGYRLGHIRGDSRIFRAIVYNKSAVVLEMLRQLVGDEPFLRGMRRFYQGARFRNASTPEFQAAMEAETGEPLTRFFDRWIYGSTLPQLKFSYRTEGDEIVLHVEQIGELFDVPLTITLQYADRKSTDVVMRVVDRVVDQRVPMTGLLRTVEISRDDNSLARIVKN